MGRFLVLFSIFNLTLSTNTHVNPVSIDYLNSVLKLGARAIYHENKPIPYIYIDDFFPHDVAINASKEFPEYTSANDNASSGWHKSELNCQYRKLENMQQYLLPSTIHYIITFMQSGIFIKFLEVITGIPNLLPDPHLYGAGMHQTLSGGHLSVHLDYNFNENLNLWRRVNVFLYLNENWEEEWGGHLELWDADRTHSVVSLSPLLNRLVVFTASEVSWHGHPEPLACPPNRSRKSIALYYYTAIDGYTRKPRLTDFRPIPGKDKWREGEQYQRVQ
jgi:Rps23 Pro-64 3,4-dihydroxylase Tpa1-like proline 4-hydroxylase